MTSIKITIIGAGSATFSAGIVRDLCVNPGLHGSHVTFMDIDPHRLEMINWMAQRLSDELNAELTFSHTLDRQQSLVGSDFIINTAQIGGHGWTEEQRSLAEKHGYYRGVQLHDFGQSAFFLDVARDIKDICPNAWLLQSANPVFEGCTLMHRVTGIKVLGLCHGHYGYREIADVLGLDRKYVSAQMPGFNHWLWMTDFRYKGQDAYPLLDKWIETEAELYWANDKGIYWANQMRKAAIHQYQLFGLMPLGDTPRTAGWWYHTSLETKQKWFGPIGGFDTEIGWGQYLVEMGNRVKRVEETVLNEEIPISQTFKPIQSDEQIVPIINALVNDEQGLYQVNIPNTGQIIKGFPEDLIIECQGVVNGSGIRGVSASPFPTKLHAGAMIPRWHKAELMVNAIRSGDRDMLLLYLLNDHRTKNLEQAEKLIDAWIDHPENERIRQIFL